MGQYDKVYARVIHDILDNGVWDKDQNVRTKWVDGTPAYTKSVISAQMTFDNKEALLLTTKKVAVKTAIKEILLFWQQKTNSFKDMHDMNVRIWDEWEIKDGKWAATIGPSYGYQLGKPVRKVKYSDDVYRLHMAREIHPLIDKDDPTYAYLDQVDYLLYQLKVSPSSRRHVVSLWNIDDLDEMALNPCVWNTQWLVKEGKLHLIVGQRSADMALGNPFNVIQYQVLQHMIAQVTGYEIGTLTFNINDAHLYERHLDGIHQQIARQPYPAPKLSLNPTIKNFYDFTLADVYIDDYDHHDSIPFEVAI